MTITANAAGELSGKFTIPTGIPAGVKKVVFTGQGGAKGETTFTGQGTLVSETKQSFVTITERRTDPLAQTFVLDASVQIVGVDVLVTAKGSTDMEVQIRDVTAGFPGQNIFATSRKKASAITVGGFVRFDFSQPIYLRAGDEYAIVVMCNDADGAIAVAELGKFDASNQKWVTSQPYTVGVLLSSSNATTWTTHQEKDMTFRLVRANYTQNEREVDLGTFSATHATDIVIAGKFEIPTASTGVKYRLTLPSGEVLIVTPSQYVRLGEPTSGVFHVAAILTGSNLVSPLVFAGTQVIVGTVSESAEYVTRAITGGSNVQIKLIYEAFIPSGSSVSATYKGVDSTDTWVANPVASTANLDDGWVELTHSVTNVTESMVHSKLTLHGSSAARPRIRNLRMIVS
jgi:hypothetical protein